MVVIKKYLIRIDEGQFVLSSKEQNNWPSF
ncbi:hypothetical protein OVS_03845 [Mycoplasma ovis str. Michigan]|uniref:Uncharacterized protein n=1 Tax=Mycoplasma ovis str. Michigan TaxID=1415773 RepID=A0ABM5P1Y8_9MOLU|nr:hypothetical protein OVS_03845 [Mycoplasma ovis str. Michigan]